jgi:hypothetical protein
MARLARAGAFVPNMLGMDEEKTALPVDWQRTS